jgi:hypothetical protein
VQIRASAKVAGRPLLAANEAVMPDPAFDGLSTETRATLLELLESRRTTIDQGMWQAPSLSLVAQAFLISVLIQGHVPLGTRIVVFAAGLSTSVAALLGLLRGRAREMQYSEAIAYYSGTEIPDVRPPLPAKPLTSGKEVRGTDGWLVRQATKSWPSLHLFWALTLILFAAADLAALLWPLTQTVVS